MLPAEFTIVLNETLGAARFVTENLTACRMNDVVYQKYECVERAS